MANTQTLNVRMDDEMMRMVDDLVAFYGKQAADLGLTFGRSDAVRVILRAAHRDMTDKLEGRS
jgi:hypothetical protein